MDGQREGCTILPFVNQFYFYKKVNSNIYLSIFHHLNL